MHAFYANKPNGISESLLTFKNLLTSPVDVLVLTLMRGSCKNLLEMGGRHLLVCAKDSDSKFKGGTLPLGKSLDDYNRYIREHHMYTTLGAK